MSDFMISRIQVRRGLRKDLPEIIHSGEICFCTDTFEVFTNFISFAKQFSFIDNE